MIAWMQYDLTFIPTQVSSGASMLIVAQGSPADFITGESEGQVDLQIGDSPWMMLSTN